MQLFAVKPGRRQTGYFRIGPYTVEDRGKFERADGAEQKVLDWIEKSEEIPLFLPEILDPVRARYLTPISSEYQSLAMSRSSLPAGMQITSIYLQRFVAYEIQKVHSWRDAGPGCRGASQARSNRCPICTPQLPGSHTRALNFFLAAAA